MATFTLTRTVAAPPETVFAVLADSAGYAAITPLRTSRLEREGTPDRNGVGAIRVLGLVGPPLREEITEYDPPRRFVYRLLSGAPVRNHVGTVELAPSGAGTEVVYRIDTTPAVPLVGPVLVAVTRAVIGQLLGGIAHEAERRAAAG